MLQSQGQKAWCVAKPGASNEQLQRNTDLVCSKISCEIIAKGSSCFYSYDSYFNHASVVMNLYYQAHGRQYTDCNFEGSGIIIINDPSEFLAFFPVSLNNYYTSLCHLIFYFYLISRR